MLVSLIELLLQLVWNGLRALVRPRRKPKLVAKDEASDRSVVLGSIIRSPFAVPAGDGPEPTELILTNEERRRHIYILGGTGCGKTNTMLQLLRSDVEQGRGVFLLDNRGDLVDRVLSILCSLFSPEELKGRLLLIDLASEKYSVPFNPLLEQGTDPHSRVRFVMDCLQQEFPLGVTVVQGLRNCLLALSGGWSVSEIEVMLTNATFRRSVLATVKDHSVLRYFARFEQQNNSQLIDPIVNKVAPWLSRPVIQRMLSARDTVSFKDLIAKKPDLIVLMSLAADQLHSDAHLMGSLLTSSIMSALMRPERRDVKGNEVSFYLDECEHFDGISEQLKQLTSEGRRFGACGCLSHQTTTQLNPQLRNIIRNVVGTQIYFAVGGGEADTLAGEIASDEPKAIIRNLLLRQKIGEAIVLRRGQPYTRIKTRLVPDPKIDKAAVHAMRDMALREFGRPSSEIDAELDLREKSFVQSSSPNAHTPIVRTRTYRKPDDPVLVDDPAHDAEIEVREHD